MDGEPEIEKLPKAEWEERIQTVTKCKKLTEISGIFGIPYATLRGWLREGGEPDVKFLNAVKDKTGTAISVQGEVVNTGLAGKALTARMKNCSILSTADVATLRR